MKIIFVNPPFCNIVGRPITSSPLLGIFYLATILDKAGYDTKIVDADRMKLSWKDFAEKLRSENPDAIGLTSTTLGMPALYKTAEACKEVLPNVKVIVGGFGPSLEPEKTLNECQAIDIIGIGEGENTILELVRAMETGSDLGAVRGIAFRRDGKPVITAERELIEDLDSIPFQNYDLLEPDFSHYSGMHGEFKEINRPNAVMMGSRGCPHRCTFCCNAMKKPRFRSPKSIVDEIEFLKNKLKVKSVQLYDNEFIGMSSLQNGWIKEICHEIIRRGLNDLGFVCQGRCSQFLDLDTMKLMRKAGFRWIWWGVESGSQKILDNIKKDLKIEWVYRAFNMAREAGLYSLMFIMVGLPGETAEDVKKTIKIIEDIKPDKLRIHIATPLPSSEFWNQLYEKGQIDEFDYLKYDTRYTVVHHTDTMSREDIKKWYKFLVFRFESTPGEFIKFFLGSLLSVSGWKKLPRRIASAFKYFINSLRIKLNKG